MDKEKTENTIDNENFMLFHSLKATREQNHWKSCYKENQLNL